jgi:3D (Asp-Asp-Asp) domain-containing protein
MEEPKTEAVIKHQHKHHWRRKHTWLTVRKKATQAVAIALFGCLLYFAGVISAKRQVPAVPVFSQTADIAIPTLQRLSAKTGYTVKTIPNIRVTAYTNRVEETDSTPNLGARGTLVYEGSIAVSQDLLVRKLVGYGDILCLTKTGVCYRVEDCMNVRLKNSVDIFSYNLDTARKTLYHSDIVVYRANK